MEHSDEEEILDHKGKAAVRALLSSGYTKEEIGELLEILVMGEISRHTERNSL